MSIISILLAVLTFGLIIFIHEVGHFVAAKIFKIKVNEFAMGMGPALFKFGKGETQYGLHLFPIGGYVLMEGETEESADPRSFGRQKLWKRATVLVGGAAMNILMGLAVATGIASMQDVFASTTIATFGEGATSSKVLQAGDDIYKINGARIHADMDLMFEMLRDDDGFAQFEVIRDGERIKFDRVEFKTFTDEETGRQSLILDFKVYPRQKNFFTTIRQGFYNSLTIARTVWVSVFDLLRGKYGINDLSGPIGVTSAIGGAITNPAGQAFNFREALENYLFMVMMISINVGVFNLLPFPALDGGRLVFLLVEKIRRKPVPQKYETAINAVGMALLLTLMIVVTISDVGKLIKP
ncbi:MAG: site-2 protease family protein [Oscillospiraceae bacterium]|jgi:regulator of sigma E protease|nr:site-2 protease family protein [Oscillospiraceae bacterium]